MENTSWVVFDPYLLYEKYFVGRFRPILFKCKKLIPLVGNISFASIVFLGNLAFPSITTSIYVVLINNYRNHEIKKFLSIGYATPTLVPLTQ